MPKRIEVTVDRNGVVKADFIGFIGDQCHEEEARFRQALAGFGVELGSLEVELKTEAQMAREADLEEEDTRRRVRARRTGAGS